MCPQLTRGIFMPHYLMKFGAFMCIMVTHMTLPFTITNLTEHDIELKVTCKTGPHGFIGYYDITEHDIVRIHPGETIAVVPSEVRNQLPGRSRDAHEMNFHGIVVRPEGNLRFRLINTQGSHSTIYLANNQAIVDVQQPPTRVPGIYTLPLPAAVESRL
jgi:hypothetical protein